MKRKQNETNYVLRTAESN